MRSFTEILVYGWYHNQNLGDELYKRAFQKLFPDYLFTFVNKIEKKHLDGCNALFFGGGSFLNSPIQTDLNTEQLLKKPIFYIGVGSETKVHKDHALLLSNAKFISTRINNIGKNYEFNSNLITSDLVYSLGDFPIEQPVDKTLLVLPNAFVLPNNLDNHWKFTSWNFFKSEMSQFLDELIEDGWKIKFFPMCRAESVDDVWAINEILSLMKFRSRSFLLNEEEFQSTENIIKLFSKFSVILTQRYHGIVLADLARSPRVVISHHDKLESFDSISYYGLNKLVLHGKIKNHKSLLTPNIRHNFSELQRQVQKILLEESCLNL